jgi:Holliday junction resolvasome RuvABC endonuclease subunit
MTACQMTSTAVNAPLVGAKRVLAVDPTHRGFGFAVLEGPAALIDWGVKHANRDRTRHCAEKIVELINHFRPDVLVIERTNAKGCLRRHRARGLIRSLLLVARNRGTRTWQISRRSVRRCFSADGSATKRQIAVALTERFPELGPHLPPVRKPWMSEDERMSIFDALAFGWASYEPLRREARALSLLSNESPSPHG